MIENLTPEQQAEVIAHKIIQATKDRIISILQPGLNKIAQGHNHFTQELADAIINDIKNA